MQNLLDKIDKEVFDVCDALQNAKSSLEPRPDVVKCQEYLHDWPPAWMGETLFTIDITKRLGTDQIREYIRTLEKEHARMRITLADIRQCSTLTFAQSEATEALQALTLKTQL